MKKLALVLLFIQFPGLLFSQGLNSIHSKDQLNVWAAGDNGHVMHSTTAGSRWDEFYLGSTSLNAVVVITGKIFMAGDNGKIFTSVNNGTSWDSTALSGTNLRSIYFTDNNTGWLCGTTGKIFKTTDAGNNWIMQNSGFGGNLNSIKFINTLTGAACGSGGTVLVTNDGGSTWNIKTTPVTSELLSVDLKNNTIMACGMNASVVKSSNMGNNWSTIDYKMVHRPDINCIVMFDENHFLSCGGGGFVNESTDGGINFSYKLQPMLAELKNMYFYNASFGWAVSNKNNVIIRTNTSIFNWALPLNTTFTSSFERVLEYPLRNSYNRSLAINNFNTKILYACYGNKLYRSNDIGETWNLFDTIPYGTKCQQLMVSLKDTNKIMAIMFQDTVPKVYRSTDYGSTWQASFNGVWIGDYIGNLMAMDPNHPDTLVLGCKDSVFRTTDFGGSWTKISSEPINDYCDIAYSYQNSNVVYLTGSHYPAKFYKSTNGGANWNVTDLVVADTIYSEMPGLAVSSINYGEVYHTISAGNTQDGARKSNTQGNTWQAVHYSLIGWGADIAKDDPNCFAYGDAGEGDVYATTNSGLNFFEIEGVASNESILYYDRANIFNVTSLGIYKSRFKYHLSPIGIENTSTELPDRFVLYQNYPNPFNPTTNIKFDIPGRTFVRLRVYNALGEQVSDLVDEELNAGSYKIDWNAANLPSGVFFYKLETGNSSITKKMILIK